MTQYDVRRTVQIKSPVTGAQIVEAVQKLSSITVEQEVKQWNAPSKYCSFPQFGEYREDCLRDIDGKRVLDVGIASGYPYGNVVVRTGNELSEGIELGRTYEKIGVISAEPLMGRAVFAVGYTEQHVVDAVEAIKIGLEGLLNR